MTRRSRRPSAPRGERGLLSTQPHPGLVFALGPPSLSQFLRTAPALSRCPPSRPRPWLGTLEAAGPRDQIGNAYCEWRWTGSQLRAIISLCVCKRQPALSEPQPRLTPTGCTEGIFEATEVKVKSPGSGAKKVFPLQPESLRHFLGKGPGTLGSLLGKGVRKLRDSSFPSPRPQPWTSSQEGQGAGIMGQRSGEKSMGWRRVWVTRSPLRAFNLSVPLSLSFRNWSGCLTLIPHAVAGLEAWGQVK